MGKNVLLEQYAEKEIARRIAKGELFTPAMVNADLAANCDMLAKMMTIAVNRGIGVGKKRFNEKVQPILDSILEEWFENKRTADQEYAISVVERMYDQIMED